MQFRDMDNVDLKLSLLSGSPIVADNIEVVPYTLRDIMEIGYSKYIKSLQWVFLSIEDFINSVADADKREILEEQRDSLKVFDFYIKLGGRNMQYEMVESLKTILRTEDIHPIGGDAIAVGFVEQGIIELSENGEVVGFVKEKLEGLDEDKVKIIHRENFDDIVEITKLQNYMEEPEKVIDSFDDPEMNEETRELKRYMDEMRMKVEEKKRLQSGGEDEVDIDMSDIVSAVSSKSNSINKLNIWDFTIYQIYDEYARLELIDNYDFGLKAMMAGAEDVDIKHWSSRI